MGFKIVFYEKNGYAPLPAYMEKLRQKSASSKRARTHLNQLERFIDKAQENGLEFFDRTAKHMIGMPHVRKVRLGKLRLFYTVYAHDTFVLFHAFEKHTQKTPEKEKKKVRTEYEDFLRQMEEREK